MWDKLKSTEAFGRGTVGSWYIGLTFFTIIVLGCYIFFFIRGLYKNDKSLRSIKRGNLTFIYFIMFLFFATGVWYENQPDGFRECLTALFEALKDTVALVTLNFAIAPVSSLFDAFPIYRVSMLIGFLMVIINAFLFVFSIIGQLIFSFSTRIRWRFHKKNRYLIIGNNANNEYIYRSISPKEVKILSENMTNEEEKALYYKDIRYFSDRKSKEVLPQSVKEVFTGKKNRLTVIINTERDEENLALGMDAANLLKELFEAHIDFDWLKKGDKKLLEIRTQIASIKRKCGKAGDKAVIEELLTQQKEYEDIEAELLDGLKSEQDKFVDLSKRIQIFIFGSPDYIDMYRAIEEKCSGSIHYINKYIQIAADFCENYPLSRFMDESQLDYANGCIRHYPEDCIKEDGTREDKVKLDIAFIGFGKTNREIFTSSLNANQFIRSDRTLKAVNYHIFSNRTPETEMGMIRNYLRYDAFLKSGVDREEYLPLAEAPGNHIFYSFAADDASQMINEIRKIPNDGPAVTFFIIAHGSDLENVATMQTLQKLKDEEGWTNVYFFVKVSGMNTKHSVFEDPNVYPIGNEKSIYSIEKILAEDLNRKAMILNRLYEGHVEKTDSGEIKDYGWFSARNNIEKESNDYCGMAFRSKLGMMGLDFVPEDELDEYFARYLYRQETEAKVIESLLDNYPSENDIDNFKAEHRAEIKILTDRKLLKKPFYKEYAEERRADVKDIIGKRKIKSKEEYFEILGRNEAMVFAVGTGKYSILTGDGKWLSCDVGTNTNCYVTDVQGDGANGYIISLSDGTKGSYSVMDTSNPEQSAPDGYLTSYSDDLGGEKTLRSNMAVLEHLRWNAFYIGRGYIPTCRKAILEDKKVSGKNHNSRQHGCITTFDGLMELRDIKTGILFDRKVKDFVEKNKAKPSNEEKASLYADAQNEADNIHYDYQIMDYAYTFASKNKCALVRTYDVK